ncbi:MAG: ArdC family protein [Candidatus Brocadiia bacterium]
MANRAYDRITNKILELLDAGVIPWRQPWTGGGPVSLTTGRQYRGLNYLLLGCAPFASRYWLTFRQAKRLGGHVKRGVKGWPCVFWRRWHKDTGEVDPDTGEPVVKVIPILRYYTVFNLEQTDGVDAPLEPTTPRDHQPIKAAQRIITGMPNPPRIEHGGGRPCYDAITDSVLLPVPERFESGEAYYSVAFHELAHSTGHRSRLARKEIGASLFGSGSYGTEELVAEMGAAFLAGEAGISPAVIDNQAAYIDGWRRLIRRDRKAVVVAAARAHKAADYILGRLAQPGA